MSSAQDHNPHKRRLHLPIARVGGGTTAGVDAAERKPSWLKVALKTGPNFTDVRRIARDSDLHTVCEEASCPNIYECWEDREATFLILGDRCTRRCGFCDVMTAKPSPPDPLEPQRIAQAAQQMGLRFIVITGVARDDLADGGASIWAQTISTVRDAIDGCGIEVLPSDLRGDADIATVAMAQPDVFAHNLETVRRLHPAIRPAFGYRRSLDVLRTVRDHSETIVTKSNLILGLGESPEEIPEALEDLRDAGCGIVTIGQYLRPTQHHLPVDRWVPPEEFLRWKAIGEAMGIPHVEAGPLVRSSYRAGSQYRAALTRSGERRGVGL